MYSTQSKVQGIIMKSAVISLKQIFEPGMEYVALSQTTSLEDLKIIDFDENKMYACENIWAAIINETSIVFLHTRPLLRFQSGHQGATLTVVHHNVEGLICHSEDMKHHHELGHNIFANLTQTQFI